MLIQEPYSSSLAIRDSDDFETLSERFSSAIETLYKSMAGHQTANVLKFEYA